MERYKHLYQPQESQCETCKGRGKVYRPDLAKIDKENEWAFRGNADMKKEVRDNDLGGGWYRCSKCKGRGYEFDPLETWGQDKKYLMNDNRTRRQYPKKRKYN